MLCYKDKTFCASEVHKPDCKRQFTKQDQKDAEKWWGKPNPPVAFAYFCDEVKE